MDITDAESGITICRRYTLTIKNEYTDIPVILQKIGTDNVTGEVVSDKLGGAVFTVYSDPEHKNVAKGNDNGTEKQLKDLRSSEDTGFFFNGRLSTGTYYIHETKAPDGYNLLLDDLVLTVSADKVELFSGGTGGTKKQIEPDPETGVYVVKINNICGYELPSTGGPGTKIFTLLGASLLTLAGILLISKRKNRQRLLSVTSLWLLNNR